MILSKKNEKIISISIKDEIVNENGRNKNENDDDEEKNEIIFIKSKEIFVSISEN